mmetsp:Transcript_4899/g.7940  ORF Transcript_4899/g.7940 Transcript_4899/m.7940 type:complete len:154 (-) Transcript_4899:42-503(-)
MLGKAIGMATNVASKAAGATSSAPPPPKKVWCVTLRRKPTLTEEDQPEIGDCEKICIKMLLIPCAVVTNILGWLVICTLYMIGTCCCPLLGPGIFSFLVRARVNSALGSTAAENQEQLKKDTAQAACCVQCLISVAIFTGRDLISPLNKLCDW